MRQVADLLGMREEAVKQRLSRARTRLRREMLERFGEAAHRTAPGAAFTAGVMALTFGAPSGAAAAGLGLSKVAGPGLLAKLAALAGSTALGVAGGIAGIVLSVRQLHAQARDDEERRARGGTPSWPAP